MRYLKVEIEEVIPSLFEKRTYVIGKKLEKWTFAIGRHQSVPMYMPPTSMIAHTDVFHAAFWPIISLDGHGERLRPVGRGNDTTVAKGLLKEIIMAFQQRLAVAIELLVPLDGSKIGGREHANISIVHKERLSARQIVGT